MPFSMVGKFSVSSSLPQACTSSTNTCAAPAFSIALLWMRWSTPKHQLVMLSMRCEPIAEANTPSARAAVVRAYAIGSCEASSNSFTKSYVYGSSVLGSFTKCTMEATIWAALGRLLLDCCPPSPREMTGIMSANEAGSTRLTKRV